MKKTLLKTMLLLCALVTGVSSAWAGDILNETFTNGLPTGWSSDAKGGGNTIGASTSDSNGRTDSKCWKLGTNSNPYGSITTSELTISSNAVLTFWTKAKSGKTPVLLVTGTNCTLTGDYSATAANNNTYKQFSVNITNVTGNVTLTFKHNSPSSGSYIYLDDIVITPSHTLTYSAENGSISGVVFNTSTGVASGASVAEGGKVTLTATPASGYTFDGWSVSENGGTFSDTSANPTTFTMGTANATVTANFVADVTSDYINVSPTTKNMTSAGGDADFAITTDQTLDENPTQFYTTADGNVTTTEPDWIDALFDNGILLLTVAENTGAARSAYFRIEKGSVKSDVITINQAAITVATPEFDVAAGTYTEDQLVDITCATEGATIYYTTDGSTPAANNGTEYDGNGVEITATTTLKAIAIKNGVSSEVASVTYTINHPLTTMDAIFAASATAESYYVTLNNWVVSGVSSKQAFVTDGTKGFIAYNNSHGFNVGDILNGTVLASLTRYNGAAEFTTLTASTTGLTVTKGGIITPQVVTIDELSGVNTGAVVQVKNVTYNSTDKVLKDASDNEIKPYNTLYNGMSFTSDTKYNVTGVYLQYNSTKEILPRSAADIVVVVGPSITVASPLAVPNYIVGTAEPTYETLTVNGSNLTADITLSLGESSKFEMSTDLDNWTNSLTLTQSEGSVTDAEVAIRLKAGLSKGAYEGTLTLSSTGADNAEVSLSGTVTGQLFAIEQYTAKAHGTISFSPASPIEDGTEVTLSAEPAEGYTFTADSWVIYKQSGEDYVVDNSITVTANKFSMPAYAIWVDGTFAPIAVTGVTLNKTKATVGIGDTEALTATIAPANALNKNVTWESNNSNVATVSNDGEVTGVAAGTATITATTEDGDFTASCDVTVMNAVTFDCSSDTETSKDGVSFTCSDISTTDGFKFYKSSESTFSVTNGVIKKIEFTCTASGTTKYGPGCFGTGAPSGYTYSGTIGTWEGSAKSVVFTATDNQVRATKIKVFIATTATPTFSVAGGEYDEAKNVEISCATDGATIYYTTNGDTPTSSSTEYTGGISITESTTLKAIAIKDEVESAVASATYTMNRPAAPEFDVAAFVFDAAFDVNLSTETDGATIYYTTDNTTPTSSSTAYDDKNGVHINTGSNVTVKAIAFKNGLTSDVTSVTYTYDARVTPSFTLSTTNLNLKVNDTSDAVSLTTNSDGTIAFTCEDVHVTLTGTGNSRTISANAAGTYTVNVSVTGSATYKDASGTITVNVTKKATTMVISTVFDDGLDLRSAHGGVIEGIVKYNAVALNPQPTITFASTDEKVATVDEEGNITFKKAGTATIIATFEGNDEYEECEDGYELELFDTTPQEVEVSITLNNTFFGKTGTISGSSLDEVTASKNNIEVQILRNDGSLYLNNTGTRFYPKSTLSFTAPTGYYITNIELKNSGSAPEKALSANTGSYSSGSWNGGASTVTFSAGSGFTSSYQTLTTANVTLAPIVKFAASGYASYCSPHALDLTLADKDYAAWAVTETSGETVTFTKITGAVPAETPFILYGEGMGGNTISLPVATGATTPVADNMLVGTLVPTAITTVNGDYTNFGLSGGAFKKISDGTLPANKAYLPILTANVPSGSDARLAIVFDNEATGISDIKHETLNMNGAMYDMQGRKVEKPNKGLYIMNGKKVIFK